MLDLVPTGKPAGLVISSARTFTRDYQDALVEWEEAGVTVWGTVPERVAIAAGPNDWLSDDGLETYRESGARPASGSGVAPTAPGGPATGRGRRAPPVLAAPWDGRTDH